MNDNKVVIVIGDVQGEITSAQSRMIERLKEIYGEQVEIITQCDFEKIEGTQIDYMIFDEFDSLERKDRIKEKVFKPQESPYWQKGRWG